jgi:predicted DCC family thiol-disulfide oxidoreductase YuxK
MLIYDGDCGFCSASAEWISNKWPPHTSARAVPWQQLGQVGLDELELTSDDVLCAAWWVEGGQRHRGHLAVAHALLLAGGGWRRVGQSLLLRWVQHPAALGYRIVVRYGYRLPNGRSTCRA